MLGTLCPLTSGPGVGAGLCGNWEPNAKEFRENRCSPQRCSPVPPLFLKPVSFLFVFTRTRPEQTPCLLLAQGTPCFLCSTCGPAKCNSIEDMDPLCKYWILCITRSSTIRPIKCLKEDLVQVLYCLLHTWRKAMRATGPRRREEVEGRITNHLTTHVALWRGDLSNGLQRL